MLTTFSKFLPRIGADRKLSRPRGPGPTASRVRTPNHLGRSHPLKRMGSTRRSVRIEAPQIVPSFEAMSVHHFRWEEYQVAVDPARQVLRLDIVPEVRWRDDGSAVLAPSPVSVPGAASGFVSASMLAHKAKAVDDGIVAALEVLLHEGTATIRGRDALLDEFQTRLGQRWAAEEGEPGIADAMGLLSAVRSLGGVEAPADPTTWPTALRLRRARSLREFRMNQEGEVPLGVYSWNERLAGLYRQAKALQVPLDARVVEVLAGVMAGDEALQAEYGRHMDLLALTNPLARSHLLSASRADIEAGRVAFFPASESPEGNLAVEQIGASPVPAGFDLVGELAARVAAGGGELALDERSGWYAHALHALEPLMVPDQTPEAARLRLSEAYRNDLRSLFRSLLGATRESHVKQLDEVLVGAAPMVHVSPRLSFEPLAEHYRRRASSYRFVRERLVALLGEDALLSSDRLTPRGPSGKRLLDEMVAMEQLYTGAWAVVLDELGLGSAVTPGDERWLLSCRAARSFAGSLGSDADLTEDVRMMVPLFRDLGRDEYQVLALVGYERRDLWVGFEVPRAIAS